MMTFLTELRHAFRALAKRPGFALVAVITLALGIGPTTAIFSIGNALLLRALPYPDADRIVAVWQADRRNAEELGGHMSHPNHEDVRGVSGLEASAQWRRVNPELTGLGPAELADAARVTPDFFRVFGSAPVIGRDFTASDDVVNGPDVVIISDAFWRERLGARREALGTTLMLGGEAHEIIGIAPKGFAYPEDAQLWLPFQNDDLTCGRGCMNSRAVARLAPNASLAAVNRELGQLGTRLQQEYEDTNTNFTFRAAPLRDVIVGDARLSVLVLLGAVAMVLLIACANVANLVLVHGDSRRAEIAVRVALGADRKRILRQLMTENALLAFTGGALGLLFAAWSIAGLKALAPEDLPRLAEIGMDGGVLLFALAIVLATVVLFGLAPALRIADAGFAEALRQGRRSEGERGAQRFRATVLVAEVALSVMLLLGAALLVRSMERMQNVDLGIDTENVVQFRLTLPETRYPNADAAVAFVRQLDERLERIPGVESAAATVSLPFAPVNMMAGFTRADQPPPEPGTMPIANVRAFEPDAFEVLGIDVLRGRAFEEGDRWGAEPVIMINEAAAKRYFPGEDPIGKQIRTTIVIGYPDTAAHRIIGITRDFRRSVTETPNAEMYLPYAQTGADFPQIAIRHRGGDGAAILAAAQREVQALDSSLPLAQPATLASLVREDIAAPLFYLVVLGLFALLAVGLAAVGIYGVVAYLVARRTREIGIRMALGAHVPSVVKLVVWQGVRPAVIGAVAGLGGALALGRVMKSILYDTVPTDPVAMAATVALLLGVVAFATALPALRAARTPPSEALRTQ